MQPLPAPRRTAGLVRVRELWGWLRRKVTPNGAEPFSADDARIARTTLSECLQGLGGEASARRRVAALVALYRRLNEVGRKDFLALLASEFGPDDERIARAIREFLGAQGLAKRRAQRELRLALASPRIQILRQFNLLADGVKFLVDLRADVLRFMRGASEFEALDEELESLLGSWFDPGNLELRRISWSSPAALLEKLIAYEAVHEIRSWTDLRNRLDSDRRCYAFFHPRMPDEPLVFVEVALVRDMAANVQALLDETAPADDPAAATAAIFYSISSTQAGLRGVSFGGFLIKRVVEQLMVDFPRLKTFATLSPIPGFRRWLEARLAARDEALFEGVNADALAKLGSSKDPYAALAKAISPDAQQETKQLQALEPILVPLCARYLAAEKDANRPIDPVARFHLGNGAQLERINWWADSSARGLKQSVGLMVNYGYRLGDIEENHEAFEREGRVAMSRAVRRLL